MWLALRDTFVCLSAVNSQESAHESEICECRIHPSTGHESPKGYLCTLSLTSALEGSGWSAPRSRRFTPLKTRFTVYRRLGGSQGRCGRVRKISPPPRTGIRSPDRPARSELLYRLSYAFGSVQYLTSFFSES